MSGDLESLRDRLRQFANDRDWGQFHTPRNLALALAGEVGELAAVLQWVPEERAQALGEDGTLRDQLGNEMADVLIYLVRMADVTGIDLLAEAFAKIERNELRYPRERARGNARKYSQL